MSEPTNRKKGGDRLSSKGDRPPKQKKQPDTRSKQKKVGDRILIIATVLAIVVMMGFLAIKMIFVKPEVQLPVVPPKSTGTPVEGVTPEPQEEGGRKEDFFTFLVVGRDTGGGGNTDTIMLVAYDVPKQKLNVMSIPRDTMVNIPYDIKRINAVYNYNGEGKEGIDGLYQEVSQLVGFRPDFEVVVEWEGFGKLVDAIGGVQFDVPVNMNYDDPTQDLHIHIKKGSQILDGEKAMQVIRYRHDNRRSDGVMPGYPDGDIGRIATQQAFMKEVINQCLKADKIISNVGKYTKIFLECVETDLSLNNLAWFAQRAVVGGLQMDNVNFITMPGNYNASAWSRTYKNYQSYVLPDGDALVALVNEHFNPYLEEVTSSDLDIMTVNGNGSLSSSAGKVEDSSAGKAPAKPTSTPKATPNATKTPEIEAPVVTPSAAPVPVTTPTVTATPKPNTDATQPPQTGQPTPESTPSVTTAPTSAPIETATTPPVSGLEPPTVLTAAPELTAVPTPIPESTPEPTLVPTPVPAPTPEPTPSPEAPPEGIPIL